MTIIVNYYINFYIGKYYDKSRRRFSPVSLVYLYRYQSSLFSKSTLLNFVSCNIRRDACHRSVHEKISVICTALFKTCPAYMYRVSYCSHFKESLFPVVVPRGVLRSCRPVYPPIAPPSATPTLFMPSLFFLFSAHELATHHVIQSHFASSVYRIACTRSLFLPLFLQ